MRRRGGRILEIKISTAQMLVASFAMSNGDCLEGRHSVKEPLILGQLWAISTLQHINAGMVMMMSTTTTMTVAMMVTTLVLENCAKCFSKIFEANFYGNGSWTKSSLCSLMLSPQRGDRKLNMGYWVSGDLVELSFPPQISSILNQNIFVSTIIFKTCWSKY